MSVVYFNGPVQNGTWTLAGRPGKAAGIRLAEALNALLGAAAVPHLWNTVTLAGDLRQRSAADRATVGRRTREERAVAAKYAPGPLPASGLLTDADPAVAALALEMTEALLADGTLALREMPVRLCAQCGHMTGTGAEDCRACGHRTSRAANRALLVCDRAAHPPVLAREDFHAAGARTPTHLLNIARNVPDPLVLCRSRDHGVSLAPLGLDGMVLDPRAGLHVAVLAAAARRGAARPVMTVTENAAANVAAHGAPFRRHGAARLRYLLHGRIPYEAAAQERLYEVHRADPEVRELFTTWYLPLCAARERAGIHTARLPSLLKFLRRAHLARPATPPGDVLAELRGDAAVGDMRWVMNARALACALADRENSTGSAAAPQKGAP
ncbi:hypothetical protein ABT039_22190 [Streptomyces lasiicapitis]|uniref:hypothetical protein n=1 Tax=Streptomyces lasiicapitis TaxID=1923961 RepID=UPI00331B7FFB